MGRNWNVKIVWQSKIYKKCIFVAIETREMPLAAPLGVRSFHARFKMRKNMKNPEKSRNLAWLVSSLVTDNMHHIKIKIHCIDRQGVCLTVRQHRHIHILTNFRWSLLKNVGFDTSLTFLTSIWVVILPTPSEEVAWFMHLM